MKNALILHGTDADHKANWFEWLGKELEKEGYKVWIPDLPHSEKSNIERYNKFIFANKNWEFNDESIIIGHSSGAVATLGLLQALPKDIIVKHAYLVAVFINDLNWDSLTELFEKPLDYSLIKKHTQRFTLFHSDNDPYCPMFHAETVQKALNAELIIKKKQGHFSASENPEYVKFPALLKIITKDDFTQQELSHLNLYVRKADELLNSKFIQLLEGKITYKMKGEKGKPITISNNLPDSDYFLTFVTRIRPFLLNDEPIYFDAICKLLKGKSNDDSLKNKVIEIKRYCNEALEGKLINMGYKYGEKEMPPKDLIELFLYGDTFHLNADKVKIWENIKNYSLGVTEIILADTFIHLADGIIGISNLIKENILKS